MELIVILILLLIANHVYFASNIIALFYIQFHVQNELLYYLSTCKQNNDTCTTVKPPRLM